MAESATWCPPVSCAESRAQGSAGQSWPGAGPVVSVARAQLDIRQPLSCCKCVVASKSCLSLKCPVVAIDSGQSYRVSPWFCTFQISTWLHQAPDSSTHLASALLLLALLSRQGASLCRLYPSSPSPPWPDYSISPHRATLFKEQRATHLEAVSEVIDKCCLDGGWGTATSFTLCPLCWGPHTTNHLHRKYNLRNSEAACHVASSALACLSPGKIPWAPAGPSLSTVPELSQVPASRARPGLRAGRGAWSSALGAWCSGLAAWSWVLRLQHWGLRGV